MTILPAHRRSVNKDRHGAANHTQKAKRFAITVRIEPFVGSHARYVLHTDVTIIEDTKVAA